MEPLHQNIDTIAEELGMSYKGAAAIYYRALHKLKHLLGGDRNEF